MGRINYDKNKYSFNSLWEHYTNELHVYCRLRDFKLPKLIAKPTAKIITRVFTYIKKVSVFLINGVLHDL